MSVTARILLAADMFSVAVRTMDVLRSSPNLDSPTSEGALDVSRVAPDLTARIMREQMEYLLNHVSASCFPGCPDCVRLEQVKRPLLRPFC